MSIYINLPNAIQRLIDIWPLNKMHKLNCTEKSESSPLEVSKLTEGYLALFLLSKKVKYLSLSVQINVLIFFSKRVSSEHYIKWILKNDR